MKECLRQTLVILEQMNAFAEKKHFAVPYDRQKLNSNLKIYLYDRYFLLENSQFFTGHFCYTSNQ
jgi:hypothetical protein